MLTHRNLKLRCPFFGMYMIHCLWLVGAASDATWAVLHWQTMTIRASSWLRIFKLSNLCLCTTVLWAWPCLWMSTWCLRSGPCECRVKLCLCSVAWVSWPQSEARRCEMPIRTMSTATDWGWRQLTVFHIQLFMTVWSRQWAWLRTIGHWIYSLLTVTVVQFEIFLVEKIVSVMGEL